MKIISKYKDYYDYLVGIYGIDDKLILDRTNSDTPIYSGLVRFHICGKIIDGYYDTDEDKFYFGNDLLTKFPNNKVTKGDWYLRFIKNDYQILEHVSIPIKGTRMNQYANLTIIDDKKYINEKFGCPIICSINEDTNIEVKYYNFPKLAETGIVKMLQPQDIFLLLNDWLSKEKPIIDNRTDEEKLISAGFDKKISFRNIK